MRALYSNGTIQETPNNKELEQEKPSESHTEQQKHRRLWRKFLCARLANQEEGEKLGTEYGTVEGHLLSIYPCFVFSSLGSIGSTVLRITKHSTKC